MLLFIKIRNVDCKYTFLKVVIKDKNKIFMNIFTILIVLTLIFVNIFLNDIKR